MSRFPRILTGNWRWCYRTKLLNKLASVQNSFSIDLLGGRYADTERVGKGHPLRVSENKSSGLLIMRHSFDPGDADVE